MLRLVARRQVQAHSLPVEVYVDVSDAWRTDPQRVAQLRALDI